MCLQNMRKTDRLCSMSPSSSGPGRRLLKAVTGVQIPQGTPNRNGVFLKLFKVFDLASLFLRFQNLSTRKSVLIIFLSAFCIRLAYLFLIYGDASSLMIEDSKLYLKLAENILSNQSQSLDFNTLFPSTEDMPLYPLFISGVFSLFGKSEICLVLSQIIIDSMTCVLIALIAKSLIGAYSYLLEFLPHVIQHKQLFPQSF